MRQGYLIFKEVPRKLIIALHIDNKGYIFVID